MVTTWVVIVIALTLIWMFMQFRHIKHKFYIILIILLLIFLLISGAKVASDNKLNLGTLSGIISAGKLYFSWLFHLGSDIKSVTGNVAKMNWVNMTG